MSSAFLWSGVEINPRKAKLSWKEVCCPKDEGGLGIRSIKEGNIVNGLKIIWKILMKESTLWTRWVYQHLLRNKSFWVAKSTRGSWAWRKILKLSDIALPFTRCVVGEGTDTDFWRDNWSSKGRLLDLIGDQGPRILGIPLDSTLKSAVENRIIRHHRNRTLNAIEEELARLNLSETRDAVLWRQGSDLYADHFSTRKTWEQVRKKQPKKSWSKGVWFSKAVPKQAFLVWLAARDRLSTLDRVTRWLPATNPTCLLCSSHGETRNHLFFSCSYAQQVWATLARRLLGAKYTSRWHQLLRLLARTDMDNEKLFLFRLTFQSSAYYIWWERNNRRHSNVKATSARLATFIDKSVRNKISALRSLDADKYSKMMIRWFSFKT